ncbi:hypothetical protein DSO57_1018797 [Entomophthora muscae]|uniref:Uncharacterized protein n=1 Tax=Entomophthora muscae TaxID=34485 RepID=A0ACC2T4M2_9FUNG|nr:hypothetical protein DSO57_1018797 [Entomophthora muscae]
MEPVLIHPNFNENFSIFTYVSKEAIGGVLAQEREARSRRIADAYTGVMKMSKYLMELKNIPGKKKVVVNGLSHQGEQEMYLVEQLAESYETKLFTIYCLLTTGEMDADVTVLRDSCHYVIIGEGIYQSMREHLVKVPKIEECSLTLRKVHDRAGHYGILSTAEHLCENYWLPNYFEKVKTYLKECNPCQMFI